MSPNAWSYPGSRWWKFDFHTHTPASKDTKAWQRAVGTPDEVTPSKWLLRFMAAGIDCVAVTDHNSGDWVDQLKRAYAAMQAEAEQGQPPEGFRPLVIFPGVEISGNGGVHVLAIFDPSASTSDIDSLLGAVGYLGSKGDSDGETTQSIAEVIDTVIKRGAIPIPAHADQNKGLLRVNPGTKKSALSAHTIQQALEVEGLLAVEWCDPANSYPEAVAELAGPLARVLGSDCHSFHGAPGQSYTWVKMAHPTLKGLRLALLDGNEVSIRRSGEGRFEPFRTPTHIIRAIEIEKARVMGNGQPARLEFSPYFNAMVGGRGTGKSTVVHALRLAARREGEIQALPKDSEPRQRFEAFRAIAKGRDDEGALKSETVIRVEWQHDDTLSRLSWCDDGKTVGVEEWHNGQWQASSSQSIHGARFPLRIFSQGQIATMACEGRQVLLDIIDEAADIAPHKQAYEEARRSYFAQCARLREIEGKLALYPEVERRIGELGAKLKTLAQTEHAAVLQAYSRAQHQQRAIDEVFEQIDTHAANLRQAAADLLLDDWPPQHFNAEEDQAIVSWRNEAECLLKKTQEELQRLAGALDQGIASLRNDARLTAWRERAEKAGRRYHALQKQLAEQGVADPQAFARLTQERQQLEARRKELTQLQADLAALLQQIDAQEKLIVERRRTITQLRKQFLQHKLANNEYVRIKVEPFGFDPLTIERSLRELIDVLDGRFAEDILEEHDGMQHGVVAQIADATDKLAAIIDVRKRLLSPAADFHGRFRNHLNKRWEKPELADRVKVWFPEDDLRIEYQRGGAWYPISQGSQGQRSAALLAFLLAFGEEPIVLDQPEDDLDNHLIYDLIVRQIRENKLRRQLIIVTHNPNVVVNGDAELVHVMDFGAGQCSVKQSGALQEKAVREEVCRVMEGGREAFARRWKRLGQEV